MVPGPDLGPFRTTSAFVRQQYFDFVGRAPTASEAAAQAKALRLGTATPQEVIRTLRAMPGLQSRRAAVTRLYRAYLARTPDFGGLEHWVSRLQAGVPLARVSSAFAGSSEFARRYGNLGDTAFVDRVYRNVLGRPADPAGRAYWSKRLAAGTSRGTVMVQFSESNEHLRKTQGKVDIVLTYAAMLRRTPTAAELQPAAGDIRSTPAGLVRSVLEGGEYADRVS